MRSLLALHHSWKALLPVTLLLCALPSGAQPRVGVGLDLFTESTHLTGEQAINASRQDESFDFGNARFLAATLSLSVPAPIAKERARIGAGVRLFGNYDASQEDQEETFGFGLFNQAFLTGEYGLPVMDKLEALLGARAGVGLLFPGREFSQEIDRLQQDGVSVWSVPRVGWLLGLSLGARRRMSEKIFLRADLMAQMEKLYLFATDQEIDGVQFEKSWSTNGMRLGLTLGAEFSL